MKTYSSRGVYGDLTQHLKAVWISTLKPAAGFDEDGNVTAKEDQVQALFNQLDLYPSKSQVYEMINCSRSSKAAAGNNSDDEDEEMRSDDDDDDEEEEEKEDRLKDGATNGKAEDRLKDDGGAETNDVNDNYLTFGEFCLFATELRRKYDQLDNANAATTNAGKGGSNSSGKKCQHHHKAMMTSSRAENDDVTGGNPSKSPNPVSSEDASSSPSSSSSSSSSSSAGASNSSLNTAAKKN